MNAITKATPAATLAIPEEEAIRVLQNSLYPGARPESVSLVLAWCRATGRDPLKKPIHIVPMWVKDATTGQAGMRDVLMPGIGTYRTDAAASGDYAGKGEPEFGPDVTGNVGNLKMTYPKWCKVTVDRLVGGQVRHFTAMEFWLENYATAGRDKEEPNAMWRKRPYGQLAKCAESQALRMAFPDETGNTNTSEEMEGKTFDGVTIDAPAAPPPAPRLTAAPYGAPPAGAPPPPAVRRTTRDLLDETRADLAGCATVQDVVDIADRPGVRWMLSDGAPVVQQEASAMLAEAYARVQAMADEAAEAAVDFPGDVTEAFGAKATDAAQVEKVQNVQ